MIYLDNAATTFPKPEQVYDAVDKIQRTIAVNVGRGGYSAAAEAMAVVDDTRMKLSAFVGVQDPNKIIITPSATIAANEIIMGLEWDEFKTVYVTPFEHNAIARPLNKVCEQYGITIRQLPFCQKTQAIDWDEAGRMFAMNPPDYLFLNQISNVTGAVVPVEQIAKVAKAAGAAVVVVDGSQSVGLEALELGDGSIDFLIFAGHKNLYASWGIGGFVYNSDYHLRPVISGGTGSDSLNLHMADSTPGGYECGSPNIIAIASLNAALDWINDTDPKNIALKKDALMQKLISGLQECGATLYLPGPEVKHTSVLSFNIPGYDADEVGMILSQDFDIAVRTGYHCAPFIHDMLGTADQHGTVRASIGYFNTESDIDALIDAVADIMGD